MNVADAEAYKAYQAAAGPMLRQFGARFLVRGGRTEIVEGGAPPRTAVIEFPDYDTALRCWNSPEYARAKALRQGVASGTVVIVESYDGPQPSDG